MTQQLAMQRILSWHQVESGRFFVPQLLGGTLEILSAELLAAAHRHGVHLDWRTVRGSLQPADLGLILRLSLLGER